MQKKLLMGKAFIKFFLGFVFSGLLLFLPAGTFAFPNAYLFFALLFIPMLFLGIILFIKNPELLEKRLNVKEKEGTQKGVVRFSAMLFIGAFLVAGFDFRLGISPVPSWLVLCASLLLLFSYGLYAEVMRENAYLSRTVEIQENQKVIDTGLYGIVRHPMYTATIFLFLSIPLVLGSFYAVLCMMPYPVLLLIRIKNEEEILEKGLVGYTEYKQKVPYRLIPFIY